MSGTSAIEFWRQKLAFFEEELAIASSADQKFELRQRIVEAKAKLADLAAGSSGAAAAPRVAPTRLTHAAPNLYGRDEELARLDAAWTDPATRVVTIVAWGGVGKTSL